MSKGLLTLHFLPEREAYCFWSDEYREILIRSVYTAMKQKSGRTNETTVALYVMMKLALPVKSH